MQEITPTESFFEAFLNSSHRVLGKRLEPYSLRHLMILSRIQSPLIHGGAVTLSDLMIAVLVCSQMSVEGSLNALEAKDWRSWLWQRNARKADVSRELNAFLAYLHDFTSLPEFENKVDENGCPVVTNEKIPTLLCHAAQLIRWTGWDEEKVLSMPLGKLIWYNLAFGYLETGDSRVVSEQELNAQRQLAAIRDFEFARAAKMKAEREGS